MLAAKREDILKSLILKEGLATKKFVNNFKSMYQDALTVQFMCNQLRGTEIRSDQVIFAAYLTYKSTGFGLSQDLPFPYKYRTIIRDIMRCVLIWECTAIKQFLIQTIFKPAENVDPSLVKTQFMKKVKIVMFGCQCLSINDFHLKQILISLQTIKQYASDILSFIGCDQDFETLLCSLETHFGKDTYLLNEKELTQSEDTNLN